MKKILIATIVLIVMVIGIVSISYAQEDEWEWIETGYSFILMDIHFPEGQNQIGYCIGQYPTYDGDGIVIKTIDGGDTWDQLTEDEIPGLQGSSFISIDTGYAGGWGGYLIKTVDGGDSWTEIEIVPDIWQINEVEFWDEQNGIVVAYETTYYTEDGGDNWTAATGLTIIPHAITYATKDLVIAVGGANTICRSTDGGQSWSQVYTLGNNEHLLLGVDFLNSETGMAVGDYSDILTTTDGGETWASSSAGGDWLFHSAFYWDSDIIYLAGTPEIVYKSTDGGTSWDYDYDSGYDIALYRVTFTDDYTGFICGSQGVVLRKEGGMVTSINESKDEKSKLSAYPNPFINTTVVEYNSNNSGMDRLTIHDVEGKTIIELINYATKSNKRKFSWDGSTSTGEIAPPGIYVGVLESGDRKEQIKLIKR